MSTAIAFFMGYLTGGAMATLFLINLFIEKEEKKNRGE